MTRIGSRSMVTPEPRSSCRYRVARRTSALRVCRWTARLHEWLTSAVTILLCAFARAGSFNRIVQDGHASCRVAHGPMRCGVRRMRRIAMCNRCGPSTRSARSDGTLAPTLRSVSHRSDTMPMEESTISPLAPRILRVRRRRCRARGRADADARSRRPCRMPNCAAPRCARRRRIRSDSSSTPYGASSRAIFPPRCARCRRWAIRSSSSTRRISAGRSRTRRTCARSSTISACAATRRTTLRRRSCPATR